MTSGRRISFKNVALPLTVFVAVIYAAFLTRTYYWDGVLFSLYIEGVSRGELPVSTLIHPNHLLYSGLGYAFYRAASLAGLHWRAITVLQTINVLASVATGYLIFRQAHRQTRSLALSLGCFTLFTFGATWWKFSTDADAYIISVLLLSLAVAAAMDEKPAMAGLFHAGAMLFHELALFGAAPILVALSLKGKLRTIATYLVLSGLPVLVAYAIAYRFADGGLHETFLAWITSSSGESKTTHTLGQFVGTNLSSYVRLFAGGRWTLIQQFLSAALLCSFALSAALVAYAVWLWRHSSTDNLPVNGNRVAPVLWAWLLPYALFLSWFEPGNAFYKLFVWPPIVLLIGIGIAARPKLRAHERSCAAISLALMAWNFGAFIFPHSHSAADPVLALAEKIDKELPKSAVVYYRVFDPDDWYLKYFAPGRRWEQLRSDLSRAKQTTTPVCFETTALEVIPAKTDVKLRWDLVNGKHNVRLECLPE